MSDLDERLLDAHVRDDRHALVELYAEAGRTANSVDASCFYLTHAYIFSLEMNHPLTPKLHAELRQHDRI